MTGQWVYLAAWGGSLLLFHTSLQAVPPKAADPVPAPAVVPAAKVDLNTATLGQLRGLPNISRAWGVRIISNRPYKTVADLKKAGLPPSITAQIKPLVTVAPPKPAQAMVSRAKPVDPKLPARLVPGKVDLNSASLEQLQNLPGVEPGMAAHILAGRPYMNFDDLVRDGVPTSTIEKIRPVVILGPPALGD